MAEELKNLSRKELQSLAKVHGIRANMKTADMLDALRKVQAAFVRVLN